MKNHVMVRPPQNQNEVCMHATLGARTPRSDDRDVNS